MRLTTIFASGVLWIGSLSAAWADSAIDILIEETGVKAGPVAMRDFPGWGAPEKIVIRAPEAFVVEIQSRYPDITFVAVTSQDEAIRHAVGADAVIGFCSDEMLQAASRAVWIQITSAGAERCVAVNAVKNGRVVLTNMQKMSSPVLGEHAVAMVMSLARGLVAHSKAMQTGQWRRSDPMTSRIQSVTGKNLLVVGLGGIGTEVARRAAALGMRVTGTRRSSREGPEFVSRVGLSHELHELAAEADFIVNTLPLTPETRGIFDADFFAAAKTGAYFVSVGRGGSTVTDDLVAAINSGQIAGAGLDVTDPEPLPSDHPLWQMENVVITPHVAWAGGDNERHGILLRDNIRRFVAGEALLNVVDPDRGY